LRVLQEGEFERVGEERTRRVKVRVIAATNRDLSAEVDAGRFRRDLYYRLSIFPLEVPPLRQRREDIGPLARHFARLAARRLGVRTAPLDDAALRALRNYDWPGNIRELQNVIERAVIMGRGVDVRPELPGTGPKADRSSATADRPPAGILTATEWRRSEKANLEAALQASNGKVYGHDGAAALLGVRPTTLVSRLKALGIGRPGK
jgi:transcriptional regulator with GAF, ATPase, and Fis domain